MQSQPRHEQREADHHEQDHTYDRDGRVWRLRYADALLDCGGDFAHAIVAAGRPRIH